jgi:hypothetical protein
MLTQLLAKHQLHIRIIALCWLITKWIGRKLWADDRLFPLVPLWDWFQYPSSLHLILFYASISLLIIVVVKPDLKYVLPLLLLIEVIACLPDQNRWQPWELYFILYFGIQAFSRNSSATNNLTLWLLCGLYLHSGLQKLNFTYINLVFPKMFLRGYDIHQSIVQIIAIASALAECVLGIGILFTRFRRYAIMLLITMHIFILLMIGPLGTNTNVIVWPWNAAMIISLYGCTLQDKIQANFRSALWWAIFALVMILPTTNFIGVWDFYPSWSLYSGRIDNAVVCISKKLPQYQKFECKRNCNVCNKTQMIDLGKWMMKETRVAVYPERRVYKSVLAKLREQHPEVDIKLGYYKYGHRELKYMEWEQ